LECCCVCLEFPLETDEVRMRCCDIGEDNETRKWIEKKGRISNQGSSKTSAVKRRKTEDELERYNEMI
jgi:hypothetical protein